MFPLSEDSFGAAPRMIILLLIGSLQLIIQAPFLKIPTRLDNVPVSFSAASQVDDESTIRITHVWSPFVVQANETEKENNPFYPLDQAQSIAWASLVRAQEQYREVFFQEVNIVCAVLWTDVDLLMNHDPPLCRKENTVVLDRSSHTEFPDVDPPTHYPFVQDVISAAIVYDYDYLILTNSDISLTKNFYVDVRRTIEDHDYDSFRVNRRTIRTRPNQNHTLTAADLDHIEQDLLPNGKHHPGTDCFVMKKDVVEPLDMGKMYFGHPPWAGALQRYLMLVASQNYKSYGSEFGLTFHVGNSKSWMKAAPGTKLSIGVSNETLIKAFEDCPLRRDSWTAPDRPPHWQQNTINCAEVAEGLKLFQIDRGQSKLLESFYNAWEGKGVPITKESFKKIEHLVPPKAVNTSGFLTN